MFIETLEARRLLTVLANFSDGVQVTQDSDGTLHIKGSGIVNVNAVENGVSQTSSGLKVGLGNVVVTDNTTFQDVVAYHVNTSHAIDFRGGSGGDTLNYDGTSTHANIQGGTGADQITILDRGNGGSVANVAGKGYLINLVFSNHATLTGGGVDDTIIVNSCFDTTAGATTDGEGSGLPAGSTLQSNNKIVVNSQGGNDLVKIFGRVNRNATDTAAGSISTNYQVNTSDGNDAIYAYGGKTTLDGGNGSDTLYKSATATVLAKNVETTVPGLT
jgi:Ca2+-binding RTX toxin-like protein